MNVHGRKQRDALDVLRRAARKVDRITGDIQGALERKDELRILELQVLERSVERLLGEVRQEIQSLKPSPA